MTLRFALAAIVVVLAAACDQAVREPVTRQDVQAAIERVHADAQDIMASGGEFPDICALGRVSKCPSPVLEAAEGMTVPSTPPRVVCISQAKDPPSLVLAALSQDGGPPVDVRFVRREDGMVVPIYAIWWVPQGSVPGIESCVAD